MSPAPLFVDILRNTFRSYTEPHVSKNPALAGMFLGNEPPHDPDYFKARLVEAASLYPKNAWEQFADVKLVIDYYDELYRALYAAWLSGPLESGAPPDVVQWHKQSVAQ